MSDDATTGPLHLTIELDAEVMGGSRLDGRSGTEVADTIAGLIRRYAGEAGLRLAGPDAVRVSASRSS